MSSDGNDQSYGNTTQNNKFSIKDFFSKCDQILNGKLHFLCSVIAAIFLLRKPAVFEVNPLFPFYVRK